MENDSNLRALAYFLDAAVRALHLDYRAAGVATEQEFSSDTIAKARLLLGIAMVSGLLTGKLNLVRCSRNIFWPHATQGVASPVDAESDDPRPASLGAQGNISGWKPQRKRPKRVAVIRL